MTFSFGKPSRNAMDVFKVVVFYIPRERAFSKFGRHGTAQWMVPHYPMHYLYPCVAGCVSRKSSFFITCPPSEHGLQNLNRGISVETTGEFSCPFGGGVLFQTSPSAQCARPVALSDSEHNGQCHVGIKSHERPA